MTELDVELNGLEQLKIAGYGLRTGTDLADAGLTPERGLIGSVLRDASPPLLLAGAVWVGNAERFVEEGA